MVSYKRLSGLVAQARQSKWNYCCKKYKMWNNSLYVGVIFDVVMMYNYKMYKVNAEVKVQHFFLHLENKSNIF